MWVEEKKEAEKKETGYFFCLPFLSSSAYRSTDWPAATFILLTLYRPFTAPWAEAQGRQAEAERPSPEGP